MGWIDRIIDMLRTTDWGLIFAQDEIGAIARKLILRRVEKNDYIFREGDTENYLVFIIHGSVVIRKNEKPEKDVIILPNGTHFGELSLIDNLPRSASAQALEDCILLILSKENYEMLLAGAACAWRKGRHQYCPAYQPTVARTPRKGLWTI